MTRKITELVYMDLDKLKKHPNNPRTIKNDSFKKLMTSIDENPDFFEARPIMVSDRTGELIIIGGNQRYAAAKELGFKQAPVIVLPALTEEKEKEIMIRDNIANGEWDYDKLANEWDAGQLNEWGLDVPDWDKDSLSNEYTQKIKAPIYEPKESKPPIDLLVDAQKESELIDEILSSSVSDEIKEFLIKAASRHVCFNYANIAEFYAHSDPDVKELFEKSALVIIDFDQAIESGFVKISNELAGLYASDYD